MNRYTLPITCARCGGTLEPVAQGASDGLETRAVARCVDCGATHIVAVTLTVVKDQTVRRPPSARDVVDHGSNRGYHQHRRNGSRPCRACCDAHAAANRRQKEPA